MKKEKINWKVVIYSVIALICIGLMYAVSWWFIVPAVILMILNQREIMEKK
jgi:plastocyanin domain-containing protein